MSAPQDPRRGVPSASAIGRIEACPASHQMALLAGDNSGKWSKYGDAIHEALATGDVSKLDAAQLETFEMCKEQLEWMLSEWAGDDEIMAIHRDSKRLGLTTIGGVVEVTDETTAKLVNTGLADVIALKFSKADQALHFFIADYKTLRGEVPEAADNPQLRNLAVLVAKRFRCVAGRVCVIQPWAGKPTLADYDDILLRHAGEWLNQVLTRERHATPDDRKAGVHCHYCPANATCSTFRDFALLPTHAILQSLPLDGETARRAIFARMMELRKVPNPDDQSEWSLVGVLHHLPYLKWFIAAAEGAGRITAESDVEFQRYYRLKPGVVREKITDVQTVFTRSCEIGVAPANFSAACSITKAGLKGLIAGATGLKGKALEAKMAEVLQGATESKEAAPQLEEVE